MNRFKHYMSSAQTYITERSDVFVGIGIVAGLLVIVGIFALINHLSGPQIVYQPIKACEVFTPAKAQSLLGPDMSGADKNEPQISGDLAVSKCGYSNLDAQAMIVAAVTIRTGINDEGVTQNKSDFAKSKAANSTEKVSNLGDGAFFNGKLGQLNVLKNGSWYLFSYGLGSAPEQNTLDQALKLAHKVLE